MSKASDEFEKMMHDKIFGPFWESDRREQTNMSTTIDTIRRYAKDGLENAGMREMALRLILGISERESQLQLTEEEAQLVIGAMPLQGLPNEPEPDESRCPYCGETKANHGDYASGEDWVCPEPRTTPPPEQPAPETGEWRYVEKPYSAEVVAGELTLKAHWTGLSDTETLRSTMRQIVSDHARAALVPELARALRELLDCETNLNGCSGVKLLDAVDSARAVLAKATAGGER